MPFVIAPNSLLCFENIGTSLSHPKIDKFVVMTTCGQLHSSYTTEEDAMAYCKRCLKDSGKKRFLILVVSKEIGHKSPEIEIEEIK